jgi:signal transduction histidine kinase
VAVHNGGPPIPQEAQTRLFVLFQRAHAPADGEEGWGLGLTLVRGCAAAHGGRVRVQSSQESGTEFVLELPLQPHG